MNEAFPAPQIGHIYYYMKIPAELAGHGGFVGDYAEKHVRIFAYLIVFFYICDSNHALFKMS